MTDPNNLADLVLIKCFNASFIRRHLDWMQSSIDLTGTPGFQAHHMAVRFYLMHDDIAHMFDGTFNGFEDYRQVVSNLNAKEKDNQKTKEELFVSCSKSALEKHFPRWLSPSTLPAALLSESLTSTMIASIMLKDWNYCMYFELSNRFFYSEVHSRRIKLRDFTMWLMEYVRDNEGYTPQALQAAEYILNGYDFRYQELDQLTDEDEDVVNCRKHMFKTYLALPSATQFVEFGVKEAKNVSTTNRSEEIRSCYAIVRSAHVTDAGNSKAKSTNVDMILNRIRTALNAAKEHVEWKIQDPLYNSQHSNVVRLLKRGHFKVTRVDKKKYLIDEFAIEDKTMNALQKQQPQQLTAAVTGHILYGKVVQALHMQDLEKELSCRGVSYDDMPVKVTARKNKLKELEVNRLIEEEGMENKDAEDLGRKQFQVLSEAEFIMEC